MIKATKIIHRNETRINVDFPYNQAFVTLLRQIDDAKWSASHKAWHIPYTKEAFGKLKLLFPDILIENKEVQKQQIEQQHVEATAEKVKEEELKVNEIVKKVEIVAKEKSTQEILLPKISSVLIEVIGRKIILKLPKNETDTKFILTLRFSKWDKTQKVWLIPNYPDNLEIIKAYFKDRISRITIHQEIDTSIQATQTGKSHKIGEKDVLVIKTKAGRLKIIFGFNKALTTAIKKMPFWSWDNKNKWWTIPFSDKLLLEIQEIINNEKFNLRYEQEEIDTTKVARKTEFDVSNYRQAPENMLLKLKELRYSERTIKAYKSLFEELINYYPTLEIDKIDEQKIIAFCQYLVIDRKVSNSTQNQAINAIKFYYERVLWVGSENFTF